jgi:hypothetical protein
MSYTLQGRCSEPTDNRFKISITRLTVPASFVA